MWKEFKAFIMRGNVLELAVAVIIAGAFGRLKKKEAEAATPAPGPSSEELLAEIRDLLKKGQ